MESERVEMSVGSGLVNGDHVANGVAANGSNEANEKVLGVLQGPDKNSNALLNGDASKNGTGTMENILKEAPEELLNMLSTEYYLSMSTLVSRSAQECWNDLSDLVERLAKIPVLPQTTPAGALHTNDQSKSNLDKKDALLNFAYRHKAVFIKLLVLLQWSTKGEDVRKTIEINYWLGRRKAAFSEATFMIGQMMQDLANSQMPNPDLATAQEVLGAGKVAKLPDLGYLPRPPLSPKKILRILKRLNHVLCTRLALEPDMPYQMQNYIIHDGRVTFTVKDEFEVDFSVLDETADSLLRMVDFRFSFSPTPIVPEFFKDDIAPIVDNAIEKNGLPGAYDFLHDLTLSYKLGELYRQAQDLTWGLWAGHLKAEMLRRTLVVQYWQQRSGTRSWIEIGIHSGKRLENEFVGDNTTPGLRLRWVQNGKMMETTGIDLNQPHLSLEMILRQVIARHINATFDTIFDKFLSSSLYATASLEIDQCYSLTDPSACNLNIQLAKGEFLIAQVEPIAGNVVLSPANDGTNRAQADLTRSKNIVDDFVSRISSLRCAISESRLHRAMSNSGWQHLPGLKLSATETENLFSLPVSRSNFYRLTQWSRGWMLAVTFSTAGDSWWLTKQTKSGALTSRLTQVIKSKQLQAEGPLTPAYLERLAEYTSGVVVLQSNSEFLSKGKISYRLPELPNFDDSTKLPSLRFSAPLSPDSTQRQSGVCLQREVELTYRGSEQASGKAVTIARAKFSTNATNLNELAASKLDSTVSISPKARQVMIRNVAETGTCVIEGIISKLRHVDNTVACAAVVKRSSYHTLQSLSLSGITIQYDAQQQQQLALAINFATTSRKLNINFLPPNSNPHQYMMVYVTQLLSRTSQSLSKNLEDVLALLRMTQPLMTYLRSIQHTTDSLEQTEDSNIRVHIIPRQAASYALHYFSTSEGFPRDVTHLETPKKLLVRMEVLPKTRGQKTLWVVRPSIEEFDDYNRPSFTSDALRKKIQDEIFNHQNTDWLRLDEGAAVASDKPEKLLGKIHECIVQWLAGVVQHTSKEQKVTGGANATAKKNNKADSKPATSQQPNQSMTTKQHARPNGTKLQAPGARSGANFPNASKNSTVKKEVITLD